MSESTEQFIFCFRAKKYSATAVIKAIPKWTIWYLSRQVVLQACREELILKSSPLLNHIKSSKHWDGKVQLEKKEIRENDISKQLSHYNQQAHLIRENPSTSCKNSVPSLSKYWVFLSYNKSHAINHVGEHFNTPILSDFITAWITLFAHSPKCNMI